MGFPRIQDSIAKNSIRWPNRTALMQPGVSQLDFLELNRIIQESRAFFNGVGIKAHHRLAVVMPDGIEMAVVYLTITSSAIFVPLNPDFSEEQIRYYFELLKIDGLVLLAGADSPAANCAAETGCPVFTLIREDPPHSVSYTYSRITPEALPLPPEHAGQQDIAMIGYTSGTTETPKIVPVSHKNLLSSAESTVQAFELDENDRLLLVTPMYRGITLKALHSTLMAGGCVICAGRYSPSVFYSILNTESPTWFFAGPAVLKSMVDYADMYRYVPQQRTLRFIRSGGAFLSETLSESLEGLFRVPVVINYGLTEVGLVASTYKISGKHTGGFVGRVFGCEVIIRDESGMPLPAGITGEVTISGPNVMAGYENATPGSDYFIEGSFRTKDLGYLDMDGYLFLTGRIKEIINRGGEKVSPYEVEAAILQHPSVQDAAVFGIPGPDGMEAVGAAIVIETRSILNLHELRSFLIGKISAYKMPTVVYEVQEIPRNESGKIKRTELQRLFIEVTAAANLGVQDQAEMKGLDYFETQLLELWRKILKLNSLRVTDDFFAYGGDSLKAAELYSGIEEIFGFQIPLNILFRKTTISNQAKYLQELPEDTVRWPFLIPIRMGGDKPPIFLVHAADGDVVTYHRLAEEITEGHPVYGLRFSLEAVSWRHPVQLEEIARSYIEDLRKVQPEGPYYLAGTCLGGIVAYEMARQLNEAGSQIAFLGMFDGIITSRSPLRSKLLDNTREVLELPWVDRGSWFAGKFSRRIHYYRSKAAQFYYRFSSGRCTDRFPERNLREAVLRNARNLYKPAPFNSDIVYFSPVQASDSTKASLDTWRFLARTVTVVDVPGNHSTMHFEANSRELASGFNRQIEISKARIEQ